MPGIQLSPVERIMLANQFRILTKLDPDYARYHELEQKITILEGGFEGDYASVLGGFAENVVPEEVMNFANRVLLMMSNILDFADDLGDYNLTDVRQVGFDHLNELGHLTYARFLFNDETNNFPGIEGVIDSHHATLHRYRAMMEVFDKAMESYDWNVEAATRVLDAGHFRK